MFCENRKYKYEVYVGNKDKGSFDDVLSIEDLIKDTSDLYKRYGIAFSISKIDGGCTMSDGTYVKENSLCISFITNVELKILKVGLLLLKKNLNQESIMVVRTKVMEQIYE